MELIVALVATFPALCAIFTILLFLSALPFLALGAVTRHKFTSKYGAERFWLGCYFAAIAGLVVWALLSGGAKDSGPILGSFGKIAWECVYVILQWTPLVTVPLFLGFASNTAKLAACLFLFVSLAWVAFGTCRGRLVAVLAMSFLTGPVAVELTIPELEAVQQERTKAMDLTCVTLRPIRGVIADTILLFPGQEYVSAHGAARKGDQILSWSNSRGDWREYDPGSGWGSFFNTGESEEPRPTC